MLMPCTADKFIGTKSLLAPVTGQFVYGTRTIRGHARRLLGHQRLELSVMVQ